MTRLVLALFTLVLIGWLLVALDEMVGSLAAAAIVGLGLCALALFANVLIAMADSPENPW